MLLPRILILRKAQYLLAAAAVGTFFPTLSRDNVTTLTIRDNAGGDQQLPDIHIQGQRNLPQ
jgi:hypothetical protein